MDYIYLYEEKNHVSKEVLICINGSTNLEQVWKLTDNFVLTYFDLENFFYGDLFSTNDSKLLLTPSESWKKSWWSRLKEKIHTLHDLLGLYIKLLTTYDNNFFY